MPVRQFRAGLVPRVDSYHHLAFENGLSEGLRTERRLFHMTFATADQKEGA